MRSGCVLGQCQAEVSAHTIVLDLVRTAGQWGFQGEKRGLSL